MNLKYSQGKETDKAVIYQGGFIEGNDRPMVLNAGESSLAAPEEPIDVALFLAMADLKAQFMDPDNGKVGYRSIGRSEALASSRIW